MPPSYVVSKTVLSKMYVFSSTNLCQTFCHHDKYLAKSAQVALKKCFRVLDVKYPVFLPVMNQSCNLLANFGKTFQYKYHES
jgi:hypothetical protein